MPKLTYKPPARDTYQSESYQWRFQEIPVDFSEKSEELEYFEDSNKEEYLAEFEFKYHQIMSLIQYLTPKQITVLNLYLAGIPQYDIAKITHCTQSSIHKALFGSPVPKKNKNKNNKKNYGGLIPKLRMLYKLHYETLIDDSTKAGVINLPKKRASRKSQRPNIKPAKVVSLKEYRKLKKLGLL